MIINDIVEFSKKIKGKILFDHNLKNLNWFNIGGKTKIYFKPENLKEIVDFLKLYKNRGKIFVLGAGSNILFHDNIFNGVIIKLGSKFSNISLLNENSIVAGSSTIDKKLSEFCRDNSIGGFEFLSCIPGSIGGGIRMNSGCFEREFKDILISVQVVDFDGNVSTIPSDKIDFKYRHVSLPNNLIFLSASFKGEKTNKKKIHEKILKLKQLKDKAQPTKIKTGGSTFKNPKYQTDKKVWELIKESVSLDTKFGDAKISKKHCNFFVNTKNAKSQDMLNLINFVKNEVKKKTNINLDLEIVLVD